MMRASIPKLLSALALAALLLPTGCVSRGQKFDTRLIPHIEIGATTRGDIQEWFGAPLRIRTMGYGTSRWTYAYETEKTWDTGVLSKVASVVGVVLGRGIMRSPVNVARTDSTNHELDVWFDSHGVVWEVDYERNADPQTRVY